MVDNKAVLLCVDTHIHRKDGRDWNKYNVKRYMCILIIGEFFKKIMGRILGDSKEFFILLG